MRTMRMIKIGTSRAHRKLFFKLRSLKGQLAAKGMESRDEVLDTVAQETGVSRDEVEEMDRHFSGRDASLDAPLAQTGTALVEVLPAPEPNQEELLADLELEADRAARLETALTRLDPRERAIIEKRHLAEEPAQLHELGQEMGITKQRVSQLERRALQKLKQELAPAA
jgi:RNA polymerase sigma-32 factor